MSAVTLESRITRLRPIEQSDIPTLVEWRNDPKSMYLWTARRAVVPYATAVEEIGRDLHTDKHVWLVAENLRNETVGMVYSYDAQFVDAHCFSTTYVAEGYRGRGHGPEMQALFLNYLFSYFNFRKVYYDVYGFNSMSENTIKTFGFVEEGRFPEHHYFDGEWHPMVRYAVYRSDIPKIRVLLNRRSKQVAK